MLNFCCCYILSYKNEKYNITIEMLLRHNKGLYRTTLNFVKFKNCLKFTFCTSKSCFFLLRNRIKLIIMKK